MKKLIKEIKRNKDGSIRYIKFNRDIQSLKDYEEFKKIMGYNK